MIECLIDETPGSIHVGSDMFRKQYSFEQNGQIRLSRCSHSHHAVHNQSVQEIQQRRNTVRSLDLI